MKKINFKHNEKTIYKLFVNNNKITDNLKRIIIKKNYISKLINTYSFENNSNNSYYYFIHGEKGFNSFLFKKKYDVVFTNNDDEVIYLEESFELNKVSKYFKNLKFIYLLPIGTIKNFSIKIADEIKHSKF